MLNTVAVGVEVIAIPTAILLAVLISALVIRNIIACAALLQKQINLV